LADGSHDAIHVLRGGYATLSITRANYDVKLKSIILGVPTLTSISDSKRRDRVLYRGMVHEPPTVSGKVFELPDDYLFIIHLCPFDWRKIVFSIHIWRA
jgi:hypothetical protein